MKSIVTDVPDSDGKPFPKLMISRHHNTIVLMKNDYLGTVVSNPTKQLPLGFSSSNWDRSLLTDYTGTVTLSND